MGVDDNCPAREASQRQSILFVIWKRRHFLLLLLLLEARLAFCNLLQVLQTVYRQLHPRRRRTYLRCDSRCSDEGSNSKYYHRQSQSNQNQSQSIQIQIESRWPYATLLETIFNLWGWMAIHLLLKTFRRETGYQQRLRSTSPESWYLQIKRWRQHFRGFKQVILVFIRSTCKWSQCCL